MRFTTEEQHGWERLMKTIWVTHWRPLLLSSRALHCSDYPLPVCGQVCCSECPLQSYFILLCCPMVFPISFCRPPQCHLWVSGLVPTVRALDLQTLFSPFGRVSEWVCICVCMCMFQVQWIVDLNRYSWLLLRRRTNTACAKSCSS